MNRCPDQTSHAWNIYIVGPFVCERQASLTHKSLFMLFSKLPFMWTSLEKIASLQTTYICVDLITLMNAATI
jgi:hypothetical protein